jgi:hypothetical protein
MNSYDPIRWECAREESSVLADGEHVCQLTAC